MVFLNEASQKAIGSRFVDELPWHSFGRKNVGYLFAIANGASHVWDFDDDNMLKFWMEGAAPDPNLDLDAFTKQGELFELLEKLVCLNR